MKTKIETEVVLERNLEAFLNVIGADNLIQVIHKGVGLYMVIFKSYELSSN